MSGALRILGLVALVALIAAAAFWAAVRLNGPAVLDAVDRISAGDKNVSRIVREQLGKHESRKLAVYRQNVIEGSLPVILFVHGGGWRDGDPDHYSFVARGLAPEGFVVVLAGYRLGDEGRYPAMVEDTADAIAWTYANIGRYGGDPGRIWLSGHSAGAYNVAQVALDKAWLEEREVPASAIAGVIGLAGPYDFFPFDKSSSIAAFGSVGAGRESQPVNLVRTDAPPMLLIHGEADEVVKPRNSRALAAGLDQVGAVVETAFYPGWSHNDPLLSIASPWRNSRDVIGRMVEFIEGTGSVSVPVQAGNR